MMMKRILLRYMAMPCLLIPLIHFSQDTSGFHKVFHCPEKFFAAINKKATGTEEKLARQMEKYLDLFEKQEANIKGKLKKKNGQLAEHLFSNIRNRYAQLRNSILQEKISIPVYSGHLDSLITSIKLLMNQNFLSNVSFLKLEKDLQQLQRLQLRLNQAEELKRFIAERKTFLCEGLEKHGWTRELRSFGKKIYYYQAQIREYKEVWEKPSRVEKKLMQLLVRLPSFEKYFAVNSQLSSLFAFHTTGGSSGISLSGLQSRTLVQQSMIDRFGSGEAPSAFMQQNVKDAQFNLGVLKEKLGPVGYNNGLATNADMEIPGFYPNSQKTKSFRKRLELGANFQSQKEGKFFPVTSDLGLSAGYKLNDKGIIGLGASFKLGWGRGWNELELSYQGIGLRSFLDYKLKGSFYLSGGYEQNFMALIHSVNELKQYSSWKPSGLIGIRKRYTVSKKIKGEMKLLWDFLSDQNVPRTQPILFRIGYTWN